MPDQAGKGLAVERIGGEGYRRKATEVLQHPLHAEHGSQLSYIAESSSAGPIAGDCCVRMRNGSASGKTSGRGDPPVWKQPTRKSSVQTDDVPTTAGLKKTSSLALKSPWRRGRKKNRAASAEPPQLRPVPKLT